MQGRPTKAEQKLPKRNYKIVSHLTREEQRKVLDAARADGYASVSDYVREKKLGFVQETPVRGV